MKKPLLILLTTLLSAGLVACNNHQQAIQSMTNDASTLGDQQVLAQFNPMFIGKWKGTLQVSESQTMEMELTLKVNDNQVVAIMDVPSQGQMGVTFDQVNLVDDQLSIKLSAANIVIKGALEGNKLITEYQQGGFSAPIEFVIDRKLKILALEPQAQEEQVDYQIREVNFNNVKSGEMLSGSLSIPNGEVKYAAIILSGSGPSTRDGDVFGHKVYKVLADLLAKQGIATLRYDDRGVGQSTGNHALATSADFATDAEAALNFMRNQFEFKDTRIGFIGHSEGGLIAAIALTSDNNHSADFFISLAGPGTSGQQLMVDQLEALLKMQNVPGDMFEQASTHQTQIMAAIANDSSKEEIVSLLRASGQTEQQVQQQINLLTSNWMKFFVKSDIQQYLQQLTVPVFALNGAKDVQVPAQQNIDGFIASVDEQLLTYKVYPELNHLFQPAVTGLPNEYSQIETTISPIVVKDIHNWLRTL